MEFFVNNAKVDITLEHEKTVGDILQSFEEECAKNNATTVNIVLNGKQVTPDGFDEACATKLADDTTISLTVISVDDISAAFKDVAKKCTALAASFLEISVKLQGGKDKEVSESVSALADLIDQFCHAVKLSALFPETFGELTVDAKPFHEFFPEFTQILGDFQQALESKDTVLIGDLAEYEISPKLSAIAAAIKE